MRSFIALNLPDAERYELHEAARPIREAVGAAAWVTPGNLHLTLKFLGDVDETRRVLLGERLRVLGAAHRPLALDVGGGGVFPNFRAPRIVWVGVAPDARLELLHHDVERACEGLGFPVDGRAFRPHITLGRLRAQPDVSGRRTLRHAVRSCAFDRRIAVSTVDLMERRPGPGGSAYTVGLAAPLGDGEER
ncbi:MAG TPA: RNA 2',3'-cyclic phosphodiesterase [Gemmatimonadaceae bacterium]|nr:RNA 2',3'-cyclic phosphodiesterase [Gemmatimonadaceae bacterium]